LLISSPVLAAPAPLPSGYLVWTHGEADDAASRRIFRMSLPSRDQVQALTTGEDIEPQISPDGRWVAYAKARLASGTDYQAFNRWSLYLVSIEGIGGGHQEIKVDDYGYWPSWGSDGTLYYNQADGKHSEIYRATIGPDGQVTGKELFLATQKTFPQIAEINECFVSPDGTWFAARTRGSTEVNGVGAYLIDPPTWKMLGRVGENGCMPYVAPDGTWGLNAASIHGVRWGHGPQVMDRKENQALIPVIAQGYLAYHPSISTDGRWVLTGQSTQANHNSGPYEIYIYRLDHRTMKAGERRLLVTGGFNGWSHLWIDPESPTLPVDASVTPTDAGAPKAAGDDVRGCGISSDPDPDPLFVFVILLLVIGLRQKLRSR
jgi:hypothetical protein